MLTVITEVSAKSLQRIFSAFLHSRQLADSVGYRLAWCVPSRFRRVQLAYSKLTGISFTLLRDRHSFLVIFGAKNDDAASLGPAVCVDPFFVLCCPEPVARRSCSRVPWFWLALVAFPSLTPHSAFLSGLTANTHRSTYSVT